MSGAPKKVCLAITWGGTYVHAAEVGARWTLCSKRVHKLSEFEPFDPDAAGTSCAHCARAVRKREAAK